MSIGGCDGRAAIELENNQSFLFGGSTTLWVKARQGGGEVTGDSVIFIAVSTRRTVTMIKCIFGCVRAV